MRKFLGFTIYGGIFKALVELNNLKDFFKAFNFFNFIEFFY